MDPKQTSEKARAMVAAGAVLLDVRTPEEFSKGHIPGATNIPVQVLPQRLSELGGTKSAVVYCAVGGRAAMAEQILRRAGFTDVLNIQNMAGW